MKKATMKLMILGILTLSFDKPTVPPPTVHEYVLKGGLQNFVYMINFLGRVSETMKATELPSIKVTAINDTMLQVQNYIWAQIEPQFQKYLTEDSIANANLKKDSTSAKHKK